MLRLYLTNNVIEEIERIVERACQAESNVFGYGIWTHHITVVRENAKHLASHFDADPEIVEIAALLHDYASINDKALYENHHVHGPREAEQVLSEFGYPSDRTEQVKECIAAHRAGTDVERRSPEAICLASADAMAHIQEVPSLLYLAYVQHDMAIDEGAAWFEEKTQRSWEKIHPRAREEVRDEYEAAMTMLRGSADDE